MRRSYGAIVSVQALEYGYIPGDESRRVLAIHMRLWSFLVQQTKEMHVQV
jgi:hypothetical protein